MTAGLVVVGGSWGALDPLCSLLARIRGCRVPVVVALHRSDRSVDGVLEGLLAWRSGMPVEPVEDKVRLLPGRVYVAPADYHLLVDGDWLELSTEAPERYSRPSIDALFRSAAESYGAGVVAVVLSGANDDGSRGARTVHDFGGRVLVQSPEEAERAEMPAAAVATGVVDLVAPVDGLADELVAAVGGRSDDA